MNDLVLALRQALRNPGFTAVAAIDPELPVSFTTLDGVMSASLPARKAARIDPNITLRYE